MSRLLGARPPKLYDNQPTSNKAGYPEAVSWAADGTLAVATGVSIALLAPGDLAGPRAYVGVGPRGDPCVLDAAGAPANQAADVHYELSHLRKGALTSRYPVIQCDCLARSLDWAPAGTAATGGCLLATVASDHRVLVFGPPAAPQTEWQTEAELSSVLLDHLEATDWAGVDPLPVPGAAAAEGGDSTPVAPAPRSFWLPPAPAAAGGKSGASSRSAGAGGSGGGRGAGDAAPDAAAQRQQQGADSGGDSSSSDSESSSSSDNSSSSSSSSSSDDSDDSDVEIGGAPRGAAVSAEQPASKVRRIGTTTSPAAATAAAAAAAALAPMQPRRRGRPPGSGKKQQQRQQEAAPRGPQASGAPGPPPPAPTNVAADGEAAGVLCMARTRNRGKSKQPVPADAASEEPEAARDEESKGAEGKAMGASAQLPSARRGRGRPPRSAGGKQQQEPAAAEPAAGAPEEGEGAAAEQAKATPPARRGRARGRQVQGAASGGAVAAAEEASQPTSPRTRARKVALEQQQQQKPEQQHEQQAAQAAAAEVAAAASPRQRATRGRTAKQERAAMEQERDEAQEQGQEQQGQQGQEQHEAAGAEAGEAAPAAALPAPPRRRGRPRKNAGGGTAAAAPAVAAAADGTPGVEAATAAGGEGSPGAAGSPSARGDGAAAAAEADGAAGPGQKRPRKHRNQHIKRKEEGLGPEPYVVPEGFSAADLPEVSLSDRRAFRNSIPLAFVRRFIALRQEVPKEERPTYPTQSSHLKEADLLLLLRVQAELKHCFGEVMPEHGMDDKLLNIECRHRLRAAWDRVKDEVRPGFKLDPNAPSPEVSEDDECSPRRGAGSQVPSLGRGRGKGGRWAAALAAGCEDEEDEEEWGRLLGSHKLPSSGKRKKRAEAALRARRPSAGIQPSELSRATAALRMRAPSASNLSHVTYQARLMAASALCCAWSPAVGPGGGGAAAGGAEAAEPVARRAGAGRWCMLAVGAKAGRVWLWRYALPARYAPGPLRQEGEGEGEGGAPDGGAARAAAGTSGCGRLELLGSVVIGSAWVNSLRWVELPGPGGGGALALVAGGSDGSVVLWGAPAARLAAAPTLRAPASPQQQQVQQPQEQQEQQQPQEQQQQPQLEEQESPLAPALLDHWGTLLPPDGRDVTALSAAVHAEPAVGGGSSSRLLVAAGKSVGAIGFWRSGELGATAPSPALAEGGSGACGGGLHGTNTLTGVGWVAGPVASAAPLLLSCSRNGALKCWTLDASADGVALAPAPAPQPCSKRKRGEAGHGAWGLAQSPGGLFVAVARHALPPWAEVQKQLQVHQKVVLGRVQLYRLAGQQAPLGAAPALRALVAAWAARAVPPPAALWDAVQLLRLAVRWQTADGHARGADGAQQGEQPAGALTAAVLDLLERPFFQLADGRQQQQQGAGGGGLLAGVPAQAWAALRCATALRRALLAARRRPRRPAARAQPTAPAVAPMLPLPGAGGAWKQQQQEENEQQEEDGEEEQAGPSAVAEWEAAIERNEMHLLQAHVAAVLAAAVAAGACAPPPAPMDVDGGGDGGTRAAASNGSGASGRLTAMLMADWLTASVRHPLRHQELDLPTAQAYIQAGEEPPLTAAPQAHAGQTAGSGPPASLPAREVSQLFGVPVPIGAAGGVEAATCAVLDVGPAQGTGGEEGGAPGGEPERAVVRVARCPATFQLAEGRHLWACRLCGRRYRRGTTAAAEAAAGGDSDGEHTPPECLLCGVALGPVAPPMLLSPPCL